MRRRAGMVVVLALGVFWAVGRPSAQDAPVQGGQTFRTGVDLIRIDVTVLDRNRAPVRGLTADDFKVRENGRDQRIVSVVEVDAAEADPAPNAWMRYAPRDVVSNSLADGIGDGQAIGIVLDDFSIPEASVEMIVGAREIARYVVNSLGPSDQAAIVYPFKPGRTQDFTSDRAKLLAAIDKFDPEQPLFRTLQPFHSGPLVGDIQRYSTAIGRDPCLQLQPVIPTLRTVTSQLATVPNRRKALFFISVGLPFVFREGGSRCQNVLYDEMRRTFETAQRFNVNIHSIDPAGAAGYQRFLQTPRVDTRRIRQAGGQDLMAARRAAQVRHDFLETLGEQTNGRPIVDSDDLEAAVADVFQEYGSYYLIGYETTNGEPDGKFRRLDVSVNGRGDVDVRARSGRWAPDKEDLVAQSGPNAHVCVVDCWTSQPKASDVQLTGLMPHQPLRLRGAVYSLAPARAGAGAGTDVEVAAVVTVRLPAVLRPAEETFTLIRTAYDADERAGPIVKETFTRQVEPSSGDDVEYDVWSRFTLPPGRHYVRFNGTSRVADRSGTVIVEVVVPDLSRPSATASPLVLGTRASGERTDPFEPLLPVVPVTTRDFTRNAGVAAFLRLFAGTGGVAAPATVSTRLLRADGTDAMEMPSATIAPSAFADDRAADYQFDLPLAQLTSGLHLLSVTASFDSGQTVRRDLVFRVR